MLNKDYSDDILTNLIKFSQKEKQHKLKILYSILQNNSSINIKNKIDKNPFDIVLNINILNIAGSRSYVRKMLLNEYTTNENQIVLLQSLSYTYLFTREYDKAYKLYNILIDKYTQDYPHNLHLGAISAIGSGHHANAVTLLELANLDDNLLYDSKYTLGLLYQKAHNLETAAIQYLKIANNGFKSKYIDFDLVH